MSAKSWTPSSIQHPMNQTDFYYDPLTDDLFTETEKKILEILPYFTAPWSLLGSCLIIWTICYDRKTHFRSIYHRLMLGMSIGDFLFAFGWICFGSWSVPADLMYDYAFYARGTFTTCELNALFTSYVGSSLSYATFLAIFFKLQVKNGWEDRVLFRAVELPAHFMGLLSPFVSWWDTAFVDDFNPVRTLPGVCWLADYPPLCSKLDHIDCVRGEASGTTNDESFTIIMEWAVITACLLELIRTVYKMESQLQRYAGGTNSSYNRTFETANQALLYIISFFLTSTPLAMYHFINDEKVVPMPATKGYKKLVFLTAVLMKTVTPLRGAFNAYIYLHKQFRTLTQRGGSLSLLGRKSGLTSSSHRNRSNELGPHSSSVGPISSATIQNSLVRKAPPAEPNVEEEEQSIREEKSTSTKDTMVGEELPKPSHASAITSEIGQGSCLDTDEEKFESEFNNPSRADEVDPEEQVANKESIPRNQDEHENMELSPLPVGPLTGQEEFNDGVQV